LSGHQCIDFALIYEFLLTKNTPDSCILAFSRLIKKGNVFLKKCIFKNHKINKPTICSSSVWREPELELLGDRERRLRRLGLLGDRELAPQCEL
jgi:hypothetical protein